MGGAARAGSGAGQASGTSDTEGPAKPAAIAVKLLLDTHVFLWMHGAPERLSPRARKLLIDAETELVCSVVVAWELGLKVARAKLTLPAPVGDFVASRAQAARMRWLPIGLPHVLDAVALPAHHADPFDRMLVAQARIEGLAVMTRDAWIARYDVTVVRA